jgi:hypothetical protein
MAAAIDEEQKTLTLFYRSSLWWLRGDDIEGDGSNIAAKNVPTLINNNKG